MDADFDLATTKYIPNEGKRRSIDDNKPLIAELKVQNLKLAMLKKLGRPSPTKKIRQHKNVLT